VRCDLTGPIVDPTEFVDRYGKFLSKGVPLGDYGDLIAKLLVTWAASYGVNEHGEEDTHGGFQSVDHRRSVTNSMARELLVLIDRYAVMRNISWDGVRVLLLLLPLTEGTPHGSLTCFLVLTIPTSFHRDTIRDRSSGE